MNLKRYDETESQMRARTIMGANFIGTGEALRHVGACYTDEALAMLATIPFSEEVLEQHKDTHVLFPGCRLSIMSFWGAYRDENLFYTVENEIWYDGARFSKERVDQRWYLMRQELVLGSTSKTFEQQTALLTEREVVPRACEVVYTAILVYNSAGKRLFDDTFVRTSSHGPYIRDDTRVFVGFESSGIYIHFTDDNARDTKLGLAAMWNP